MTCATLATCEGASMGGTLHEHCNRWQEVRVQPDTKNGGLSMKTLLLTLLACLPLAAFASSTSKVNGSVRVEAGQTAGDVSTVNGSVTIEEGATAEDVDTVNGSVTIERNATVQKVESVNGGVSLAADVKAASVETVNGTLKLAASAQVSGSVSAVNG